MKKTEILIVALLFVCTTNGFATEETTTLTGSNTQNQGMQNTQVIQFINPEDSETNRVLSAPQAYPGGDYLQPPMIPMRGKPMAIQTRPYYSPESRYTIEELTVMIRSGEDLFQGCKGPKKEPNTSKKVYTLSQRLNDEPIKVFRLDGPANGFWEETLLRGNSIAAAFGAHRVYAELELFGNTQSASNGAGSAVTGSMLGGGDTAAAGSIAPRIGKAESQVFDIPRIAFYCYDDGPVPPAVGLLSPPAVKSVLVISLANGFPKDEELIRIANLICANRMRISVVTLIGISRDPGINLITYEAMLKIGLYLREKNCESSCPQQVRDLLQAKTIVGENNIIKFEVEYR